MSKVVIDNPGASATAQNNSTVSITSFTVGTDTNRLLLVAISTWSLNDAIAVEGNCTWQGVSSIFQTLDTTSIAETTVNGDGVRRVTILYVLAPASGTGTIQIFLNVNAEEIVVGATSWSQVNQNIPFGTTQLSTGTGAASDTLTVSSQASEIVHDAIAITAQTGATLSTANNTKRWDAKSAASQTEGGGQSAPGAASVNSTWTFAKGTSAFFAHIAVAIHASPDGHGLQVEVGSFTANTGGVTTTVSCGFQGKVILLFTDTKTSTGESARAAWSFGASDGTNHRCIACGADDAASLTNMTRYLSAGDVAVNNRAVQMLLSGTNTANERVIGVALNGNNFVLTWNATPASAYLIGYVLIGGEDITNVFTDVNNVNTTAGNQAITGVGFKPDFVLIFHHNNANQGPLVDFNQAIGCAVSPTKQWAQCHRGQDNTIAGTYASSRFSSSHILIGMKNDGTLSDTAVFTSMDADGFTINWDNPPAASHKMNFLCIKGGRWDVGTQAKPATATTQTLTGMVFTPKMLGYLLSSPTVVDTATNPAISTIGFAASSAARGFVGVRHSSSGNPTAALSANSNALISHEMGATANADFTSFNSDGWTVTWDAAGTALLSGWFAAGDSGPGVFFQ